MFIERTVPELLTVFEGSTQRERTIVHPLHLYTHHSSGEGEELVVHISLHLLCLIDSCTLCCAELVDGG